MRIGVWPLLVILELAAAPFTLAALPEPPNQHKPWTPPESSQIPEYMPEAVAALFEAGLADPRGGVYREIEVLSGNWGNRRVKTRGWVFPEGFAVTWNGLVYRTLSVGEPGDLDEDVKKIIASDPRKNGDFMKDATTTPPEVSFWFDLELRGSMVPASTALLLRLDRPDLAGALWRAYQVPHADYGVFGSARNADEWFRNACTQWLITAFHRLTGHFSNADDRDAVDVGESLVAWGDRLQSSIRKEGKVEIVRLSDIGFLEPVPRFLADARRRLGGPVKSPWPTEIEQPAIQPRNGGVLRGTKARMGIAELINRLEDIQAEKFSWPGNLTFSLEPVCLELFEWGDAAVEPLLDTLENDWRLTRTLEFDRPWSIVQKPVWVREVAAELLGNLLDAPALVRRSAPGELRVWWMKNKSTGRLTRQFGLLAADNGTPESWITSAQFITRRSDIIDLANGWSRRVEGGCEPDKPAPPMAGEELRARYGTEVTELLHRRTLALAALHRPDQACRMAFFAYLWDPASALPSLQAAAQFRSCLDYHLVIAGRLALHDLQAANDWSEWMKDPMSRHIAAPMGGLLPLWLFPENPVLTQTAEWLAANADAPVVAPTGYGGSLLAVPAFRRAALRLLGDATVVGSVSRSQDGVLSYRGTSNGFDRSGELDSEDNSGHLPPGATQPLRANDFLAWELADLPGAPSFLLDWPESERNAAIQALAKYIETNADRFRAIPARLEDVACGLPGVYLAP